MKAQKQIVLAFGIAPVAILLLAACHPESAPLSRAVPHVSVPQASAPQAAVPQAVPQTGVPQTAVANRFVGNAVCGKCHAGEFQAHRASRHARTLRFMNRQSLGAQSPPTGRIPNTVFQLAKAGDGFGFGLAGRPTAPLQLAFGSGKSGMAFTIVVGSDMLAEARMSYFPPRKQWYVTPGQEGLPQGMPGNIMQGASARQCVSCHVVTLPVNTL